MLHVAQFKLHQYILGRVGKRNQAGVAGSWQVPIRISLHYPLECLLSYPLTYVQREVILNSFSKCMGLTQVAFE